MPELTDLTNDVTNIARDAAYVVVGLGVLGLQKAQVQRVGLTNKLGSDHGLEERISELRANLRSGVTHVDEIVERAFEFVESALAPLEEQLPSTARDLAHKTRSQAREVHSQIRGLVIPAA